MEGVCELAWHAGMGSQRHYCDNASVTEVIINETKYGACWACLAELIELGRVKYVAA